ncbi:MAG: DUF1592 domain-containing protein [Planctomycetes bacterium]|nr:DUF1592 domain-containing protein [Planctomycetota bacterium]
MAWKHLTADVAACAFMAGWLATSPRLIAEEEGVAERASPQSIGYETQLQPLLRRHCFDCHGEEDPQGDLNLSAFGDEASVLDARPTWMRVWSMLHAREMPPPDATPLAVRDRHLIVAWVEEVLARPEPGRRPDPGRVALRRLNRVEYNNTVQDLFSMYRAAPGFDPRRGMPEEIRIVPHRDHPQRIVELPPDDVGYGYDNIGEVLSLPPFLMEKYLQTAQQVVNLAAGDEQDDAKRRRQTSPIFVRRGPAKPDRQRAEDQLRTFLSRAFRRPTTEEELSRYLALYDLAADRGASYESALKVPLQAILTSPHFLFKVENGVAEEEEGGVRPLCDFELATRLSYFLWSSMPDEELFRLAEEGRLRDSAVLRQQTLRMLQDRRVKQFIENFPLQWLQITNILGASPDEERFPHFHKQKYVNEAMRREALLLFETVVVEDRDVLDLVDPDFAWLNGALADYYGVAPGASKIRNSSMYWKRYPITDRRRGGVLTMGAPLVATSDTVRTSPVRRGKWVLETLLGAPPPPPLDNVPDLDNTPPAEDGLSLRRKLELHRADQRCASCHRRMDPLGFALENYDAAGAWRDADGPLAIDARGELADGSQFDGPVALKDLLVGRRRDDVVRCLTEHLMTYALGRRLEHYDLATVSGIVAKTTADDRRFSTLIVETVQSYPFRYMRSGQNEL